MRRLRSALRVLPAALLIAVAVWVAGCADGEEAAAGSVGPDAEAATQGSGDQGEGPQTESDAEGAESEAGGESEAENEASGPRRETSTTVTTAPVVRAALVLPVKAEGSIRARHVSELKFERAGRITRVLVREGHRVRQGQLLVKLDERELRLALEEATSRYLQGLAQLAVEEEGYQESGSAERSLDERRAELERLEQAGEITRQERLDRELELGMEAVQDGAYRRELLEVRSGVATARADAAKLQIELERTEIRAPFGGVVSGLELDEGETVQVGQTALRVVDDINVEAAVGVLESDLGAIEVGKRALLEVPALGETIPLQVDVIDPEVSAESRTCRVLLRLRSDEHRVKPGMFVRAWIAGEVLEDRLLVPREAIVTRDGRPVLFKVDGDRALWVYVELGRQNDKLVEIERVTQGGPLDPGTEVVVSDHLTMTHEAKIKVRETIEVPDPWVLEAGSVPPGSGASEGSGSP
jgi:RND family efflux transporter MFP subunit